MESDIQTVSSIDWHLQAQNFSPYYNPEKKCLEIPIGNSFILLHPGPAFGDLTHPTTRMVLSLLPFFCKGKTLIDIGTGSAILAMAALTYGSPAALGIEIDPDALEIAHNNLIINNLDSNIKLSTNLTPLQLPHTPFLITMNMTFHEQQTVFSDYSFLFLIGNISLITSGIISEQREEYISYMTTQGFNLYKEICEENWLTFVFQN